MITIKYYYITKDGEVKEAKAVFYDVKKAIRFLYKCKTSKNMRYSGDITCDNYYDLEYINRKFR